MITAMEDPIPVDGLTIVPANEASWDDIVAIFGTADYPFHCQCPRIKVTGWLWRDTSLDERLAMQRASTACGSPDAEHTSGLVAYLDHEPVGRVAVERGEVHVGARQVFEDAGFEQVQTAYETGLAGHHSWRGDHVTLDPEIHDERFLAATVRGRGTTVLTACSHAGVVNVGLEARRLLPDQPIDLLAGGYHLAGAAVEDRIGPTVRDLDDLVAPRIVAPGHCTGWRAAAALASAFSPTRYAPSVVGARYLLNAE